MVYCCMYWHISWYRFLQFLGEVINMVLVIIQYAVMFMFVIELPLAIFRHVMHVSMVLKLGMRPC
jgi:hypothetical protein